MAKHMARPVRKPLCLVLALALLLTSLTAWTLSAQAAGTPTSLGLGEHGIKAYREGWLYSYGGKGETNSDGVRVTDCAGLIYSYFKDLGAEAGCYGGATSQVNYNCVFSGDIDELYGIPRIHGLVLTMPDYNDPATGIYSHIGIYIGNNIAVDNSDYNTNMRMEPVEGRDWTAWHVFDNGTLYPSNGWYQFDGALYHYTNCQYDVDTTVDGILIGSDGIALDSTGAVLTADSGEAPALSEEYVSATTVAQQLATLGYSGKDSTQELVNVEKPNEDQLNAYVTGNGVSLRQEPNTDSQRIATLYRDDRLKIVGTVTGQTITDQTSSTDQWYSVVTESGREGYVCSLYVEQESPLSEPVFSVENGALVISAGEGVEIRYTTDGTRPSAESTLYTEPLYTSGTYRAVAVQGDWTSPMVTTTFAGGILFTDFTSEDWYFTYVDRAVSAGLFNGRGGEFDPSQNITRAEFAAALANLAGVDVSAYSGASRFSDVSSSDWYSGAVNWVATMGYMSGMGDGTFGASNSITREQICVALANYAGLSSSGSSAGFSDDSDIASWAKSAVYACRDLGIVSGMGYNTFAPKSSAQRAQACTMVLKAYDLGL